MFGFGTQKENIMANIFDGFNKINDQGVREQIAVLETVTMANVLKIYGEKAYKGITDAVNYIGKIFDKEIMDSPNVQELDEQIRDCVNSMTDMKREALDWRLRRALSERSHLKNNIPSGSVGEVLPSICYDDEALSIAVVDGAAELLEVDQELSPVEKIEVVNQRYAERMLTEMRKKIKEEGPEAERKLAHQLEADIAQLSSEERDAMKKALKVERISGETVRNLLMTTGGTTLLLGVTSTFGGYVALTTIMHAVFTTALGITLPFAAYTGAVSIVSFLTGPVGWAIFAGVGIWQFQRGSSKVDGEVLAQSVFLARVGYKRPFTAMDEELPSWISPSENPEEYELRERQDKEIARLLAIIDEKDNKLKNEQQLRKEAESAHEKAVEQKKKAEEDEQLAREKLKEYPSQIHQVQMEKKNLEEQIQIQQASATKKDQDNQQQIRQLERDLKEAQKREKRLIDEQKAAQQMLDEAEVQQSDASNTIKEMAAKIEKLERERRISQEEKEKAEAIANQKIEKCGKTLREQWNIFFKSSERSIEVKDQYLNSVAKRDTKLRLNIERKMKEIFDAKNPKSVADRGKMHAGQQTLHCSIRKDYRLH